MIHDPRQDFLTRSYSVSKREFLELNGPSNFPSPEFAYTSYVRRPLSVYLRPVTVTDRWFLTTHEVREYLLVFLREDGIDSRRRRMKQFIL